MHLVVFDIDGTLVESSDFDGPLYVQAIESVLGIRIDPDWSRYRNVTDSGILDEICSDLDMLEARSQIHESVRSLFIELVGGYLSDRDGVASEVPGARAFVERLSTHPEVTVAFATGGWEETALMKLDGIGLAVRGLSLASASDSVDRTEIMLLAERRALGDLLADRRTYFGDGPWDQKASAELGFDFVAIGERLACAPRFADFNGSDEIMSSLGLLN
jgi:beta-phosphoglucomutase-like phosphatase (HAD superfamily)